ncbi:MAG TPA: hypothetical protein VER11_26130 [Polyangiaceae bacterium]|nr:hypothetical protein [Polyangiaceae bacterium]
MPAVLDQEADGTAKQDDVDVHTETHGTENGVKAGDRGNQQAPGTQAEAICNESGTNDE